MKFQAQNPIEVANFVIDLAKKDGKHVTNLQLQKILFFLQGYSLANFKRPLVNSSFSKWKYGPVQQDVYQSFRSYGSSPIVAGALNAYYDNNGKLVIKRYPMIDQHSLGDTEVFRKLEVFTNKLLSKSAWQLVNMTHIHPSWSNYYDEIIQHNADDYKNSEILDCYEDNKESLND
ncbi:Panacea domain-containing protein [Lactobacillus crispatus]|uniref:Panacea domain-containing protein n=1 Tax=Lactobacillus crispatus TaxID=47770 RepID=UPI001040D26E|nr:type II toxin-antitoxin system antitoxin SocA domain-containing protein [Lactobacillus crispatus]